MFLMTFKNFAEKKMAFKIFKTHACFFFPIKFRSRKLKHPIYCFNIPPVFLFTTLVNSLGGVLRVLMLFSATVFTSRVLSLMGGCISPPLNRFRWCFLIWRVVNGRGTLLSCHNKSLSWGWWVMKKGSCICLVGLGTMVSRGASSCGNW